MKKPTERSSQKSRRSFVKTAAWVAPAVLTLKVTPAFAQYGSTRPNNTGGSQGIGGQRSGGRQGGSQGGSQNGRGGGRGRGGG